MKRVAVYTLLAVALIIAPVSFAAEITDFESPEDVRQFCLDEATVWVTKPANPTGCASGDCCPDTSANDGCNGLNDPVRCCSAAGDGDCDADACVDFAKTLAKRPVQMCREAVTYLHDDASWSCSNFQAGGQHPETACNVVPANKLPDFAEIFSEMAGRQHPQF